MGEGCGEFWVDFQVKISSTWELKEKKMYIMKKERGSLIKQDTLLVVLHGIYSLRPPLGNTEWYMCSETLLFLEPFKNVKICVR